MYHNSWLQPGEKNYSVVIWPTMGEYWPGRASGQGIQIKFSRNLGKAPQWGNIISLGLVELLMGGALPPTVFCVLLQVGGAL